MSTATVDVSRLGLEGGENLAASVKVPGPGGVPMLGYLAWYSIKDNCRIDANDLRACYAAHALPARHAPRPIRNRHAFRRASSAIFRRVPTADGEIRYLVRDVATGPKDVTRALVAEEVDKQGRRVAYFHLANWVYQDETDSIYCAPGSDTPSAEMEDTARQLFDQLRRSFAAAKEMYTSGHVRQIVRRVLDDLYPVVVRPSGGVYFVAAAHEGTLKRLQAFVTDVGERAGTHTEFRLVPLVDTGEQRDMVRTAVVHEVQVMVKDLVEQMRQIHQERKGQDLRPSDLRLVGERWEYIVKMVTEYRQLLEDQLAELHGYLTMGRHQVMAFLASGGDTSSVSSA